MIKRFLVIMCALIYCQTIATGKILQEKRLEFTLPSAPWTLTVPADHFKIAQKQTKPDGSGVYFYLTDETQDINLSMYIEPAKACKDSKACRDMVWKAGNPAWQNPKNIVQAEIDGVSTFEFLLPSFQGMPVQQQNLFAEFVVDGYWVDMHLSKVLYKPEEHQLFERIIKSIKFEPKKNPNPASS
jgi:hypothetical protein